MKIKKYSAPAFNLSLRSIYHLFISGSIFYFARSHFDISLHFAVIAAFLIQVTNEAIEIVTKVENSFHTKYVFQRDRALAILSILFTTIIVKLHLGFAVLPAPASLIALTSFMDSRLKREKAEKRNFIKPVIDILTFTLGPIACVVLLQAIKIH